jgi:Mg/Co/Ni transporter MgtE
MLLQIRVESPPEWQAAQIIEELEPGAAAAIVNEMGSEKQADVIGRWPAVDTEAVFERMRPEEASDTRRLMQYHVESAE